MKNYNAPDYKINPEQEDNTEAVLALLDSIRAERGTLQRRLLFPPGVYRFSARSARVLEQSISNHSAASRKVIFDLSGLADLRIEGEDAYFLFSGHCLPFALLNCRNLTLKGISVDFTDPHCLQARVLSRNFFSYTIRMEDEHRCAAPAGKLSLITDDEITEAVTEVVEWDPNQKRRVYRARDSFFLKGPCRDLGQGQFKVYSLIPPRKGNAVVMRAGDRTQPGVLIHESRNIHLESLIFRHVKGICVLGQMSENLTLTKVVLAPQEDSSRCFSGHDDAFHFSNCRGTILLEECCAQGQMDDGLNVHGTYTLLNNRVSEKKLILAHKHHQSRGFNLYRQGDEIKFLKQGSLDLLATGCIHDAKVLPDGNLEVRLEEDLSPHIPMDSVVENASAAVDLTLRSCLFKNNRARGVLFTTAGRVLVEDCDFQPSGAGILIAGDACTWYESGGVRNVTIRNNRFKNCNTELFQYCQAVISILPELTKPGENKSFHRNITITGNQIETFDRPVLYARSTADLVFEKNEISWNQDYKAYHPNKNLYTLEYCRHAEIRNNAFLNEAAGRQSRVKSSENCHITSGKPSEPDSL